VVEFLRIEALGGAVLLAAIIAALILTNSPLADAYQRLWQHELTVGGLRRWTPTKRRPTPPGAAVTGMLPPDAVPEGQELLEPEVMGPPSSGWPPTTRPAFTTSASSPSTSSAGGATGTPDGEARLTAPPRPVRVALRTDDATGMTCFPRLNRTGHLRRTFHLSKRAHLGG
jgi:Na+/H+ antiporter 1